MMNIEDIISVSSTKSKMEVEDLVKHLNDAHNQNLTYEKLVFLNQQSFIEWFTNIQAETQHSFRKRTATDTNTVYYCTRSSRNEGKCNYKVQRTSKATCPAHFVVTRCRDNRVDVKFASRHYCDSSFAEKSDHSQKFKSDQKWISEKLLDQIPIEIILQNIQIRFRKKKIPFLVDKNGGANSRALDRNQPDCLVTMDLPSSTEYVSLYEINDYSPIILYKRQGMSTFDISPHGLEISGCDMDEFLLVMMDVQQCETLMRFGSGNTSVVCIDSTINQEQLDAFHLSVLMVRDENRNAFPVAYMYSNRNTESTFTLFFHAIRSRTGVVNCNAFISDMSPVFYNAWNIIMGCCPHHLYSAWQMDESFRVNTKLYIANDNKLASYVYKKLRALLDEADTGRLEKALSDLLWKLAENPFTVQFGEFFEAHYVSSIELWARCYRVRYDVGTNNHLERMHNIFKHVYLKCMKNCNLDMAICSLLNLVYHEEFYRVTDLCLKETVETFDNRGISRNGNNKSLDKLSNTAFGQNSNNSNSSPINRGYDDTVKQLKEEVNLFIDTVGNRGQILSVIDSLRALKPKQDHTTCDDSSTAPDSCNELINNSDNNGGCTIVGPNGETYELLPIEKQDPAEIQLELDCCCE